MGGHGEILVAALAYSNVVFSGAVSICMLNLLGSTGCALDNVHFYRVVKGHRQELAGVNTKVASGVWQTLTLRAEGNSFSVAFNGKTLFNYTDKTFNSPGKVALWTKADSVTRFDWIEIKALPGGGKSGR